MLELSFNSAQAKTTIVVLTMTGAAIFLNISYVSHTLVDVRARVRARPNDLTNTDTD